MIIKSEVLPDEGSNLDSQIQNLMYYHYTIGQKTGKTYPDRGKMTSISFSRLTLLPDEDSNLDKQNQNLSYYHYTIGQSPEKAAFMQLKKGLQK